MVNDKYIKAITSQHKNQSNFISWLTYSLNKVEAVYSILQSFTEDFDIDTAIGAQLDIIGVIIGRSRSLDFQPTDGSSPVLDDDTYRMVLKAKTLQNQWNGRIDTMYKMWNDIFPDLNLLYITDYQDMTMKATIVGVSDLLQINLIENGYILPKPQGVTIIYEFAEIVQNNIFFGVAVQEGTFERIYQIA